MQEPRFTDLDKSLLESMGCEVVDHPGAFQHINQNTFVYAIHCAFHLLWNVKEKADPALLIANNLRDMRFEEITYRPEGLDQAVDDLENSQQTEEEKEKAYLERYEKTCSLKQGCEEIAFPELRNDFSDTTIYWRRAPRYMKPQEPVAMENS
jgi:hypothetical protein